MAQEHDILRPTDRKTNAVQSHRAAAPSMAMGRQHGRMKQLILTPHRQR